MHTALVKYYLAKNRKLTYCDSATMLGMTANSYTTTHYGYNYYIGYTQNAGGTVVGFSLNPSKIKQASKIIMMMDAIYDKTVRPPKGYYSVAGFSQVHLRHGANPENPYKGEANIVYCDGHAATIKVDTDNPSGNTNHPLTPLNWRLK